MIKALLELNDGRPSGRSWLRTVVKPVQRALVHAGHPLADDGWFGPATEAAVKSFQASAGVAPTGVTDRATWDALEPHLLAQGGAQRELYAQLLPAFDGELAWVHEQEGYAGRPYWPGGESGVTLDPGMDLGHGSRELVERLYRPLMSAEQFAALEKVFGIQGEAARDALAADPLLATIVISEEQADAVMPHTAKPYWSGVSGRFTALAQKQTLPSVQTVLLSLAYNRGANNRDLEQLRQPLDAAQWSVVADKVGAMQQDHALEGIRIRRRREADLIRAELEVLSA